MSLEKTIRESSYFTKFIAVSLFVLIITFIAMSADLIYPESIKTYTSNVTNSSVCTFPTNTYSFGKRIEDSVAQKEYNDCIAQVTFSEKNLYLLYYVSSAFIILIGICFLLIVHSLSKKSSFKFTWIIILLYPILYLIAFSYAFQLMTFPLFAERTIVLFILNAVVLSLYTLYRFIILFENHRYFKRILAVLLILCMAFFIISGYVFLFLIRYLFLKSLNFNSIY